MSEHTTPTTGGTKHAHNVHLLAMPPLAELNRPTVTTEEAAYYLGRAPQTLRRWACYDDGPIRPVRIFGRLAWPVAALRQLLEVQP